MPRYIDAKALYEQTAGWEASALSKIEEFNRIPLEEMTDEERAEWRRWTAILGERSAFKRDVADAPTADVVERKRGKWIKYKDRACWYCSECTADNYYAYIRDCDSGEYEQQDKFCPNCGADMRGEEDA